MESHARKTMKFHSYKTKGCFRKIRTHKNQDHAKKNALLRNLAFKQTGKHKKNGKPENWKTGKVETIGRLKKRDFLQKGLFRNHTRFRKLSHRKSGNPPQPEATLLWHKMEEIPNFEFCANALIYLRYIYSYCNFNGACSAKIGKGVSLRVLEILTFL